MASTPNAIPTPARSRDTWSTPLFASVISLLQLGTAISIISVSLLAMPSTSAVTPAVLTALGQALVSALLMNVAIVGLNQVYDVEIDKVRPSRPIARVQMFVCVYVRSRAIHIQVNKPYLPLASGEFSVETGKRLVAATTVAALGLGLWSGSPALLATLAVSKLLGILYSAGECACVCLLSVPGSPPAGAPRCRLALLLGAQTCPGCGGSGSRCWQLGASSPSAPSWSSLASIFTSGERAGSPGSCTSNLDRYRRIPSSIGLAWTRGLWRRRAAYWP